MMTAQKTGDETGTNMYRVLLFKKSVKHTLGEIVRSASEVNEFKGPVLLNLDNNHWVPLVAQGE